MSFYSGRGRAGFTLIELLVVIGIIGVLASIVMVSLGGARDKGRDTRRLAELKEMAKAIALADTGVASAFLPTTAGNCGGTAYAKVNTCTTPSLGGFADPGVGTAGAACKGTASGAPSTAECQYSVSTVSGAAGPTTLNWQLCTYLKGGVGSLDAGLVSINSATNVLTEGCN